VAFGSEMTQIIRAEVDRVNAAESELCSIVDNAVSMQSELIDQYIQNHSVRLYPISTKSYIQLSS
jgi:hypothetical protein